jgi:hypothetical protein
VSRDVQAKAGFQCDKAAVFSAAIRNWTFLTSTVVTVTSVYVSGRFCYTNSNHLILEIVPLLSCETL